MKTQKLTLVFAIIALALALAIFSPLPSLAQSVTAVHFELGGHQLTVESGGTIQAKSGSTVQFDNGSTTTFASGSALNVPAASLVIGNASFTGAIKYGTAATYTSGSSITHGFTVTPTMCFISPSPEITATYTLTATGFSSNTSTRTNPIYWQCGK